MIKINDLVRVLRNNVNAVAWHDRCGSNYLVHQPQIKLSINDVVKVCKVVNNRIFYKINKIETNYLPINDVELFKPKTNKKILKILKEM